MVAVALAVPRVLPSSVHTLNAMVYIKFLTLEIETASADPATVHGHAAEGLKLYPALKDFQEHYVDVPVGRYVHAAHRASASAQSANVACADRPPSSALIGRSAS